MRRLFLLLFCFLFVISAAEAVTRPVTLVTAQQQVAAALAHLDNGLQKAAGELGKTGLTGPEARRVLATACKEFSYAVDCATIDVRGRLTTVEPATYHSFEGKDISGQEQVRRMLKLHRPVLSSVFRSIEGYEAVDAEYPIFNPEGGFIGAVSVMFKPEKFLGEILRPVVQGVPLAIWAMEREGRILYDVDTAQVGLNLFTSPLYQPYKQLIQLGRKIARTNQGEGTYHFKKAAVSGEEVRKQAYWQSVSLYGTSWRLVGIHLEPAAAAAGDRPSSVAVGKSLEEFAADHALKAALSGADKNEYLALFRNFYEATPGIYSVQWIDARGMNRSGYPAENSLSGYDYHAGAAAGDKEILSILMKQQPAALEAPLFEGRVGSFIFRPVFRESQYLGMIYSITLK